HAPGEKSKKVTLTAGRHPVAVEYFEQAGGEELTVQVKVPGTNDRRDLAEFITAKQKVDKPAAEVPANFVVNTELATKGREMFVSLGCASCHAIKIGETSLESKITGKPLSELKTEGGCLAKTAQPKTAWFPLSDQQRTSIVAALKAKANDAKLVGEAFVQRQL